MKTRPSTGYTQIALSAALCTVLAACGGGGGSGSGAGGTPTNNSQITGRAIDGYLPNVTICFDNGQGVCDTSLPTTTTDANGNYSLEYTGNVTGKHLLAIVPAGTTDATNGTTFQQPFVLGAIIGGASQNITPFTSMVVAQLAKGVSHADATTAVQKLAGVDPDSDYVASGNTAAETLASATVSLLTTYGGTSPAATRNVLNAVIDAGGTAGVTQTLINTEAAATALHVAATSALASTLYAVDGYLGGSNITGSPTYTNYVLRDTFSLSGSTLSLSQDDAADVKAAAGLTAGDWTPLSPLGGLDDYRPDVANGGYELRANGAWTSAPVTPNQAYGAKTLSSAGDTLAGTDTNTGIGYTVTYGTVDVSGQPLAAALPVPNLPQLPDGTDIASHYGSAIRPFMGGTFASGTTGYVAATAWAQDRVVLPSSSTYIMPLASAASDANNVGTLSSTSVSSVQSVIGIALPLQNNGSGPAASLTLNADGSATIAGAAIGGATVNVSGSWKALASNASVLVVTLPVTVFDTLDASGDMQTQLRLGHSLVIAFMNGALYQGLLLPATQPDVSMQFDTNGIGQIKSSFDAAIKAAAAVNAAGIY